MYMGIRGPDGAGEGDLHEGEEPGEHHGMVVHLRSRNICTLGGFNVSNLMEIKRRMTDIGKKIAFYFLQNV
jgi:hypothetical protein